MAITVSDILCLSSLKDASVIAGQAGLDRPVRWIHIMDSPDIIPWVQESDLLLTAAYALSNQPEIAHGLIDGLAAKNLAGMILVPHLYIEDVPVEMIEDASRCRFPLITISSQVRFEEITQQVLTTIVADQFACFNKVDNLTAVLIEAARHESGLEALEASLSKLFGRRILLLDQEGQPLTSGQRSHPLREAEARLLAQAVADWGATRPAGEPTPTRSSHSVRIGETEALLHPLRVGQQNVGHLCLLGADRLGLVDSVNLAHASALVALELVWREMQEQKLEQARGGLLHELILGQPKTAAEIIQRVELHGLAQGQPYVIGVFDIDDFRSYTSRRVLNEQAIQDIKYRLGTLARRQLPARSAALISQFSDSLTILQPSQSPAATLADLVPAKQQCEQEFLGLTMSLAVSDLSRDFGEIPHRHRDARRAICLARRLRGHGQAVSYEEFRLFGLFDEVLSQDPEAALRLAPELHGLIEHDCSRSLHLVETVHAYLEHGLSLEHTAESLCLHRNSVRYRLDRAQELLPAPLSDPAFSFRLRVALTLHRLRQRTA